VDVERRATQRQGELIDERAAIEAQLTELHHRKSALEIEHPIMVDLTKARARAVAATINREGPPQPTFSRANENVVAAVALLDTLPAPSIDRVDKVFCQLKDILGVATAQQAESSL
jgi:hypothetical protein